MAKTQIVIPDWGVRDYTNKVKLHQALVCEYFRTLYFEVFSFGRRGDIWSRIIADNPSLKDWVWAYTKKIAEHDRDKLDFDTGLGKYYAARYTAKHSKFTYPAPVMEEIEKMVISHRTSNAHHLEFYKGKMIRLPYEAPELLPEESIEIQYIDLLEMAADWLASGEEDGADPETWFKAQYNFGSFKITEECAKAMSHLLWVAHPFLVENCKLQRFGNNPTELNYGEQERNIRKVG